MTSISKIQAPFVSGRPADRNIHLTEAIDEAAWLWHPECSVDEHAFVCFKKSFNSDGRDLTIHISADMRYRLFCDGESLALGPDRSDVEHWTFNSYQLQLEKGEHELRVEVWWLGDAAPQALITHRGGFCLKADGSYHEQLSTGTAEWQALKRGGWSSERKVPPYCYHDIGHSQHINAAEWFQEDLWQSACIARDAVHDGMTGVDSVGGWKLYPSPLPEQFRREIQAGTIRALVNNPSAAGAHQLVDSAACNDPRLSDFNQQYTAQQSIEIPADTQLGILIDLEEYYCGFPLLQVADGTDAYISWEWAESLYQGEMTPKRSEADGNGQKGNRNEIENKYWYGFGHSFTCDGQERMWQPYWWSSGRYVFVRIHTKDQALTIKRLALEESRYPLEQELTISTSNPLHEKIQPICLRVLQSCSHESYMDCPYYEQMQYVGDTRLELLAHYVMQNDRRLPKRAIQLFDYSRSAFGFVAERTTSRWKQQSNSFAAIWVLCLHDFALWNPEEAEFIQDQMLGMHANLDCFLPYREADGLIHNEPGWTFIDWVPGKDWSTGYAPGYHNGRCCAILNCFYLLALRSAADLETHYGSKHLAAHYNDLADATAAGIKQTFWNAEKKLLADDKGQQYYSQHANCLGIIAGLFTDTEQAAVIEQVKNDTALAQCTIYFKYYLFEALYRCQEAEALHAEYAFWGDLVDQGLKTCVEAPEPTRSDCHAWGAHPVYHLVASIAGLRPAGLGKTFDLKPCLHDLDSLDLSLPHPQGTITLALTRDGQSLKANYEKPNDVTINEAL